MEPLPTDTRQTASAPASGDVVVPRDDNSRDIADSILPPAMIAAGEDVIDRADLDMRNYVSGETTDWDSGMIAVAVYRAMTEVGSRIVAAAPRPSGDEKDAYDTLLDAARDLQPAALTLAREK